MGRKKKGIAVDMFDFLEFQKMLAAITRPFSCLIFWGIKQSFVGLIVQPTLCLGITNARVFVMFVNDVIHIYLVAFMLEFFYVRLSCILSFINFWFHGS